MKRRTFLISTFTGTAALALGTNLYLSDDLPFEDSHQNHHMIFSVLIPVFLAGALPKVPNLREESIQRTLVAIQDSIKVLPVHQAAELQELLGLLESRLGLLFLTGSMTPLMLRTHAQLINMLESWRFHFTELMMTAYQGLRELIMASYYSCPEHWGGLNYAKPNFLET